MVRSGKGGKRRTVPPNATAREMPAPWLTERYGMAVLFPGGRGRERLTRQGAWEVLRTLAARARIEGLHPHQSALLHLGGLSSGHGPQAYPPLDGHLLPRFQRWSEEGPVKPTRGRGAVLHGIWTSGGFALGRCGQWP